MVLILMVVLMVGVFERSMALILCKMNDDGFSAYKPTVTQPNPVAPTP